MEQKKKIFSDSVKSVAGLAAMNVALQLAVYPTWERRLGSDGLGNILYLISLMNILAVSMGVSVNHARMRASAERSTGNTPYLVILALASVAVVGLAFVISVSVIGGAGMSLVEAALFGLVACATAWRYYADVEYKLSLDYSGFCLYYLSISAGYLVGALIFHLTGLWQLNLLAGELAGLAYVLARGRVLRPERKTEDGELGAVVKTALVIFGSEALSALIFNADRIMLRLLIDGAAVTEYYLASLLGKTVALLTVPLSGVVMGYLAKYKGALTVRTMNTVCAISVGSVLIGTLACTAGSFVLIPMLYPEQFKSVRRYFMIANLAQVSYFVASTLTVVLLRFASSRYQLYVNGAYALAFAAICIPCTLKDGFDGFCKGLAVTCFIRLGVAITLGYHTALVKQDTKPNPR